MKWLWIVGLFISMLFADGGDQFELIFEDSFDYKNLKEITKEYYTYDHSGNKSYCLENAAHKAKPYFYENQNIIPHPKDGFVEISATKKVKRKYPNDCEIKIDSAETDLIQVGWLVYKKEISYGKLQLRVKFPQTLGTWGAFWIFNDRAKGDVINEIDFIEYLGRGNESKADAQFAVHSSQKYIRSDKVKKGPLKDWVDLEVIWLPNRYELFIDGKRVYELEGYEIFENKGKLHITVEALNKHGSKGMRNWAGLWSDNSTKASMYIDDLKIYKWVN